MPRSNRAFGLSADYITFLHDYVVGVVWPGVEPVGPGEFINRSMLESAAARPFQTAAGSDAYPGLVPKAAALFHSLVSNHPFQNGNKRTAVVATHVFLIANGCALSLRPDDMRELAEETATYRSRGVSHEEMLHEITETLASTTVPLNLLKGKTKFQNLRKTYQKLRRAIRRHPANQGK